MWPTWRDVCIYSDPNKNEFYQDVKKVLRSSPLIVSRITTLPGPSGAIRHCAPRSGPLDFGGFASTAD